MSNWFQDHPATSVIVHTILVAGATWAVSHFILDTQKLENLETIVQSYSAKNEVLERESETLREQNLACSEVLRESPGTVEFYQAKIKALETRVEATSGEIAELTGEVVPVEPESYRASYLLQKGKSFTDPKTGATLGVSYISSDYEMNGVLNLPGEQAKPVVEKGAGESWSFTTKEGKFRLILREVNWIGDTVRVEVVEEVVAGSGS